MKVEVILHVFKWREVLVAIVSRPAWKGRVYMGNASIAVTDAQVTDQIEKRRLATSGD